MSTDHTTYRAMGQPTYHHAQGWLTPSWDPDVETLAAEILRLGYEPRA